MSGRANTLKALFILLVMIAAAGGGWMLLRPPAIPKNIPDPADDAWRLTNVVSVEKPPRPSEGYVGSAVCRDCHADICETYAGHSMGRATEHVSVAERIEDWTSTGFDAPPSSRRPFDVHYFVSEEEGVVYHHERATAPDGTLLYNQAVPVHYEVGSGVRGRSYVTNRDGILLMSPITWYSDTGVWDFSPGYRIANRHFERRILDGCIHCHTGRLAPVEGLLSQFDADRPIVEGAISCERCHGPADQHVAFQRGELPAEATDQIVNPSDLDPHRRDSICYQCHFHGIERFPRYGRTEYDFRPGDDLCDVWTVFVRGTGVEENATVSAVTQTEQMLSSKCYQQSAGRLGCVSCHDPHSLPGAEQRVEFYRSQCLECHAESDPACSQPVDLRLAVSPEDSCIDCHMPKIPANDVPHTSQTDHRVLRIPDSPSSEAENRLATIFREESGVIPDAELRRARALFLVKQAESSGNLAMAHEAVEPLKSWLSTAPDDLAAIEALGMALAIGEEINLAVEVWEHGLDLNPKHEDLLNRMFLICQEYGQIELALEYGERLVEVNPWNHEYWGRLAHLLGQQGRFEEGIVAAERAIAIRPSNSVLRGWLAEAHALVGNDEQAAEHRRVYEYLTAGQ